MTLLNSEKSTLILIIIYLKNVSPVPWIKKANCVKYYLTTYIKPIVDPVTYLNLLPSGSVPGRLMVKQKLTKPDVPLDQSLP